MDGVGGTTDIGPHTANDGMVDNPPVRVLVVDDGASFRRAAASVIAATDGFILAGEAVNGEEAIAFLHQHTVALMLMDVCMPGMGGMEAAGAIHARFTDVVIVLLSASYADEIPADNTDCAVQFCSKAQFGPQQLERLWQRGKPGPR